MNGGFSQNSLSSQVHCFGGLCKNPLMEIVGAFAIREFVSREWVLALAGIVSVAFGILLFFYPGAGILSILWLVGIYGFVFGILFIVRAFQLRSWASSVTA